MRGRSSAHTRDVRYDGPMHPFAAATHTVVDDSLTMMRDSLRELPPEATDWRPAGSANSLTVLVRHSISATLFWLRAGAGGDVSLAAYRAEERTPAFESSGGTADELAAEIDRCLAEAATVLSGVDDASLERVREWPEDPTMRKTGATCLVHAIGHLREHVGQAQLTRDLWLARDPGG